MPPALRRLKLSPRALALAGAAIVVYLIWRRGTGGDGGSTIEGPLTTIPGGTEEFPTNGGMPITIPLPPTGGIIHIPGEDPILIEPPPPTPPATPTPPPPAPTKPAAKPPPSRLMFGRYWRSNQLPAFYQEWRRRHKGRDTNAAWKSYLRRHPGNARFFGLRGKGAHPAAPLPQPHPAQAAAAGSPPNTPRAMAAVPKPRATPRAAPRRRVTTVSGARVIMPDRPLRGPRSPRRRPTALLRR